MLERRSPGFFRSGFTNAAVATVASLPFDTNPNRPKQDMNKSTEMISSVMLLVEIEGPHRMKILTMNHLHRVNLIRKGTPKQGTATPSPKSEDPDEDDDIPEAKPTTHRPKQGAATPSQKPENPDDDDASTDDHDVGGLDR
ncbi:hypothetical protein BASA83_004306 [Batrachochytrium salamandrivorans]|nr:hypothetical protein BASA83_004306 [Batrachochytrium salamandrivorans]